MNKEQYWRERGIRNGRNFPMYDWMQAWNAQPDLRLFWKQAGIGFDQSTSNYLRAQSAFERGFAEGKKMASFLPIKRLDVGAVGCNI